MTTLTTTPFMKEFCIRVETKLQKLIENMKNANPFVHNPTLFGNDTPEFIKKQEISHFVRQMQMKEGEIGQATLGSMPGWIDLGIGHPSGLDIMKEDNTFAIELKNKWNTCNSSSELAVKDKLAKYKLNNPQCTCILGIINPKPNKNGEILGKTEIIKHSYQGNDFEILKVSGSHLFRLVFTYENVDYSEECIKFVKNIIYPE